MIYQVCSLHAAAQWMVHTSGYSHVLEGACFGSFSSNKHRERLSKAWEKAAIAFNIALQQSVCQVSKHVSMIFEFTCL